MSSQSSQSTKGRGSLNPGNTNRNTATSTANTTTTTSRNSTNSTNSTNNNTRLRRLEIAFLILVAIFSSLTIFVNFIHEYDIHLFDQSQSGGSRTHPQFHGVSFRKVDKKGNGQSTVTAVHLEIRDDGKAKGEVLKKEADGGMGKNALVKKDSIDKSDQSESAVQTKLEQEEQEQQEQQEQQDQQQHTLGGLSCSAFGGPSDEIAQEMIYWRDIPSDAVYESPFKQKKNNGPVQYMTFEPDGGGWNNIRSVHLS